MTRRRTNIGPALHTQPKRAADAELRAQVLGAADQVFDRYVAGESFEAIARTLPLQVSGWKLRETLMSMDETREVYANANILRSHYLMEAALDYSREAAALGDAAGLRTAIDTSLKVAAKLNSCYSDKATIEHTGQGGGPIKLLALTDEQLQAIAAQGMKDAA